MSQHKFNHLINKIHLMNHILLVLTNLSILREVDFLYVSILVEFEVFDYYTIDSICGCSDRTKTIVIIYLDNNS